MSTSPSQNIDSSDINECNAEKLNAKDEAKLRPDGLDENDENKLYPAVSMYGPCTVKNLKTGSVKLWCACGLSKNQPWCDEVCLLNEQKSVCDGSHSGTGILPMKWTVNKQQQIFQICACKYTKDPPYCDATHTNLPCDVMDRQTHCKDKIKHCQNIKLCTGCGWIPDF